MLTRFTKKVPGTARARVTGRLTPQFSRLEDSSQLFTSDESLVHKYKNNVIKQQCTVARYTCQHDTFCNSACNTRARVTRVQDFLASVATVIECIIQSTTQL